MKLWFKENLSLLKRLTASFAILTILLTVLPFRTCMAATNLTDRMLSIIGRPSLKPNEPAVPEATNPSPAKSCEMAEELSNLYISNEVVLPTRLKIDSILVSKTHSKLWIISDNQAIRAYDIALGFNSKGHKFRKDDGRTPEGRYFIKFKDKDSGEYYPALEISYPNTLDKKRSQDAGYSAGDNILIHGLPKDPSKYKYVSAIHPYINWTQGCIAVNDLEMDEIFSLIPVKTVIDICP